MASIITHNFFGKEILSLLDSSLQSAIIRYYKHFEIGQQGADFFFYHIFFNKHVKKTAANEPIGAYIHNQPYVDFYIRNKDILESESIQSPIWIYYLGFLCHYFLDVEIHRTISMLEEQYNFEHFKMESELDHFFLKINFIDSRSFYSRNLIPHPKDITKDMYPLFKSYFGVTESIIYQAILLFRIGEDFFHVSNTKNEIRKKKILDHLNLLEKFNGKFISPISAPKYRISNSFLYKAKERAIPKAIDGIYTAIELKYNPKSIPDEYYYNFLGDKVL